MVNWSGYGKAAAWYTCNSNHRYGNEYCTAHTIREPQLDDIIHTELAMLRHEILDSSQKYDEIVKDWNKKKPKYDKMIKDYSQKIEDCGSSTNSARSAATN